MNKKICIGVALLSLLFSSCSSKPPFQQVPSTIQFVTSGMSPKWDELTRTIVPKRINKKVNASIVSFDSVASPTYNLLLTFHSTDKEVTGSKSTGLFSAAPIGTGAIGGGSSKSKVLSIYTLEARATLTDATGKTVWAWNGYAEDKDADDAVEMIADKIAVELLRKGWLIPTSP